MTTTPYFNPEHAIFLFPQEGGWYRPLKIGRDDPIPIHAKRVKSELAEIVIDRLCDFFDDVRVHLGDYDRSFEILCYRDDAPVYLARLHWIRNDVIA